MKSWTVCVHRESLVSVDPLESEESQERRWDPQNVLTTSHLISSFQTSWFISLSRYVLIRLFVLCHCSTVITCSCLSDWQSCCPITQPLVWVYGYHCGLWFVCITMHRFLSDWQPFCPMAGPSRRTWWQGRVGTARHCWTSRWKRTSRRWWT